MKYLLKLSIFLIIFFSASDKNFAEFSGVKTFGSFQSIFFYQDVDFNVLDPFKSDVADTTNITFLLQQFDIFFQSSLTDKLSMFSDIEMKTNFNSEKNWGYISIQEAWVNYSFNDFFNVKFGSLYPEFNYLNSIRNRLNLMPYIHRPGVYETSFSTYVPQEDFIPERAFIEFYGIKPYNSFNFEYAIYMGNSEGSYYSKEPENNSILTLNYLNGIDSKSLKHKLYGLKLGINKADDSFKFGVSLTHDYNNLNDSSLVLRELNSTAVIDSIPISYKMLGNPILGDVPRFRLGLDLSFSYKSFRFESEFIKLIYYNVNYDKLSAEDKPFVKLGGEFYYGTLIYNYDESMFLFASYDKLYDDFQRMDFSYYTLGGGYKIYNNATIKFNYFYLYAITKAFLMIQIPGFPPSKVFGTGDIIIHGATFGISVNF